MKTTTVFGSRMRAASHQSKATSLLTAFMSLFALAGFASLAAANENFSAASQTNTVEAYQSYQNDCVKCADYADSVAAIRDMQGTGSAITGTFSLSNNAAPSADEGFATALATGTESALQQYQANCSVCTHYDAAVAQIRAMNGLQTVDTGVTLAAYIFSQPAQLNTAGIGPATNSSAGPDEGFANAAGNAQALRDYQNHCQTCSYYGESVEQLRELTGQNIAGGDAINNLVASSDEAALYAQATSSNQTSAWLAYQNNCVVCEHYDEAVTALRGSGAPAALSFATSNSIGMNTDTTNDREVSLVSSLPEHELFSRTQSGNATDLMRYQRNCVSCDNYAETVAALRQMGGGASTGNASDGTNPVEARQIEQAIAMGNEAAFIAYQNNCSQCDYYAYAVTARRALSAGEPLPASPVRNPVYLAALAFAQPSTDNDPNLLLATAGDGDAFDEDVTDDTDYSIDDAEDEATGDGQDINDENEVDQANNDTDIDTTESEAMLLAAADTMDEAAEDSSAALQEDPPENSQDDDTAPLATGSSMGGGIEMEDDESTSEEEITQQISDPEVTEPEEQITAEAEEELEEALEQQEPEVVAQVSAPVRKTPPPVSRPTRTTPRESTPAPRPRRDNTPEPQPPTRERSKIRSVYDPNAGKTPAKPRSTTPIRSVVILGDNNTPDDALDAVDTGADEDRVENMADKAIDDVEENIENDAADDIEQAKDEVEMATERQFDNDNDELDGNETFDSLFQSPPGADELDESVTQVLSTPREYLKADTSDLKPTLRGHTQSVWVVDFGANGTLASGSDDKTVKLWQTDQSTPTKTLRGHRDFIAAVDFADDGSRLVTGSADGSVIIWNAFDGRKISTIDGFKDDVAAVAFSPNGQFIAIGDANEVALYDAENGNRIRELLSAPEGISAVDYSNNGDWIAIVTSLRTVIVGTDGDERYRINDDAEQTYAARFSTNNRYLATAGADGSVMLYNADDGTLVRELPQADSSLLSLAISTDNNWLAAGSSDGKITLYDLNTNLQVTTLTHTGIGVFGLSFSPDGQVLASTAGNRTIKLFDLSDY